MFSDKYGRVVIDENVDKVIKDACIEISKRYEIKFLEIGTDKDHIHLLIQSVPTMSCTQIVKIVKVSQQKKHLKTVQKSRKSYGAGNFGQMSIM